MRFDDLQTCWLPTHSDSSRFLLSILRFSQKRCCKPAMGGLCVVRQRSVCYPWSDIGPVCACVVYPGFGLTYWPSCREDLAVRSCCSIGLWLYILDLLLGGPCWSSLLLLRALALHPGPFVVRAIVCSLLIDQPVSYLFLLPVSARKKAKHILLMLPFVPPSPQVQS